MAIDMNEVRHVAYLARITLDEADLELFTRQLGDILEYVAQIEQADVSGVDPMEHASHGGNVWREDIPMPSLPAAKALEQAPKKAFDHFRVPRVVE